MEALFTWEEIPSKNGSKQLKVSFMSEGSGSRISKVVNEDYGMRKQIVEAYGGT